MSVNGMFVLDSVVHGFEFDRGQCREPLRTLAAARQSRIPVGDGPRALSARAAPLFSGGQPGRARVAPLPRKRRRHGLLSHGPRLRLPARHVADGGRARAQAPPSEPHRQLWRRQPAAGPEGARRPRPAGGGMGHHRPEALPGRRHRRRGAGASLRRPEAALSDPRALPEARRQGDRRPQGDAARRGGDGPLQEQRRRLCGDRFPRPQLRGRPFGLRLSRRGGVPDRPLPQRLCRARNRRPPLPSAIRASSRASSASS